MLSYLFVLALSLITGQAAVTQSSQTIPLPVHNITRYPELKFENLAVRCNGQILTTTTSPNASIYQVDPLDILPLTLIYQIPNITSATGIVEGKPDVFYVAFTYTNITNPTATNPASYLIMEIDVRGMNVQPNGTLTRQPAVKQVAHLPGAALLNGIAMAGASSNNLLVADSFRGLIWNVNTTNGEVGVTLNDTTTKGPSNTGPGSTGINGIKVHNETLYWTNTGRSSMYKVPIDEEGNVLAGETPLLVTSNLPCDDLELDNEGNAYVAGPLDVVTKVSPSGEKEIIAGTFNSTNSSLGGPTALRFGRLASDLWSLYITTNGGLAGVAAVVPGSSGISRIDLGQ